LRLSGVGLIVSPGTIFLWLIVFWLVLVAVMVWALLALA
jgi:hypothetical protein